MSVKTQILASLAFCLFLAVLASVLQVLDNFCVAATGDTCELWHGQHAQARWLKDY